MTANTKSSVQSAKPSQDVGSSPTRSNTNLGVRELVLMVMRDLEDLDSWMERSQVIWHEPALNAFPSKMEEQIQFSSIYNGSVGSLKQGC
jgi:hypothetical protein